jgi:4-amino-4-deoxy-L-arabinose transferase-like glycosyltransferase
MVLVFWLTLAFWSGARWLGEGKRRHALVFGVALGCACLTKGPVGLLPLLAIAIAVTLLGRWSKRALEDLGLAFIVLAGFHIVWLGLALSRHADLGWYLDAVRVVFDNELSERRHEGLLYVPEAIGVGFLPWTFLVPGAALALGRRWRTSWSSLLIPVLWAGLVLVIFGVFLSPRSVHFLPCYPALALLVAWAWSTASPRERWWMSGPLGVGVVVIAILGLAIAISPVTIGEYPRMTDLSRGLGFGIAVIAGAVTPAAFMLLRRERANEAAVLVSIGALLIMLALQIAAYTPGVNRAFPTKEVAARLAPALPEGASVAYLDRRFTTGLMFYLPSRPVEVPDVDALPRLVKKRHVALLLRHEELRVIGRGDVCLPTRTLLAEFFDGTLYVLADVNGAPANGPPCSQPEGTAW